MHSTLLAVQQRTEILEADGTLVAQSDGSLAGEAQIAEYLAMYDVGQLHTRTRVFIFVLPADGIDTLSC